jgi:hypothetical protein
MKHDRGAGYADMEVASKKSTNAVSLLQTRTPLQARTGAKVARKERSSDPAFNSIVGVKPAKASSRLTVSPSGGHQGPEGQAALRYRHEGRDAVRYWRYLGKLERVSLGRMGSHLRDLHD